MTMTEKKPDIELSVVKDEMLSLGYDGVIEREGGVYIGKFHRHGHRFGLVAEASTLRALLLELKSMAQR